MCYLFILMGLSIKTVGPWFFRFFRGSGHKNEEVGVMAEEVRLCPMCGSELKYGINYVLYCNCGHMQRLPRPQTHRGF